MKKIIFKKINFLNFKASHFLKIINKSGLFVFPSGPGLATIDKNDNYLISLQNSDYVFFDSGYFVLLLRILKGIKVSKFSGYKFLKLFFCFLKKNNKKSILCIDPNFKISVSNRKYLKKLGIKKIYNYIAPKYNTENLKDLKLVNKINKIKPNYIITNIGGGVQEILGYYLKKKLNYKATIFCTGAAISYFTGNQAPINLLVDKYYLGWFLRIIFNPKVFLKRYISTFKLGITVLNNEIKIIR